MLSAGRGRPAGSAFGGLVLALLAVVAAGCGACGLWLVGPGICCGLGGTRDIPVEVLFPQGRERFESGSSGWSRVLRVNAVGGPPDSDLADECCAWVASHCSPDRPGVTLVGVIVNLVGEVGDLQGSPCQVLAPNGMVMECGGNARKPGQRTWVGRRERCQAPVQDGGQVTRRFEVASADGCQQVAEWVLTGFGRECEQMGSQAWPCGFGGESGDVPIGLVELGQGLWSDELFGREVEGVGVTLDGVVQAGGGVVEFAQLGGGGGGGVVAGEDLLQASVGVRGATVSGRTTLWGSPSPTTWR